jgi:hypothetical protein
LVSTMGLPLQLELLWRMGLPLQLSWVSAMG